ncbi:CPBP family intramembrane metalloprotease [Streptococcus gallolyticus]|nr:CPBP family intramembrane metalloprotease [Streptococcus gallolyticus]MBY5040604.1 CPBP family intramembrane metalloprotease [Streptococcus gallolyticus]
MKKIVSGSLLLILWVFLYQLSAGVIQIAPLMTNIPIIVWVISLIGIALLGLLVWFYQYLYKEMKLELSGLNEKFQIIWGPLALYVFFMVLQILFPVKASNNQQAVMEFITAIPIPAFFNVVVLGPILEEYIFRGLLRGYFFPEIRGMKQAMMYCLVSSILFSLIHMPNTVLHFFIYGTMGFAFSWLYLAKNDLRYPIALHMLNNLLSFISILML